MNNNKTDLKTSKWDADVLRKLKNIKKIINNDRTHLKTSKWDTDVLRKLKNLP